MPKISKGTNFTKKIPLYEISENIAQSGKKLKKGNVVVGVFKTSYFSMIFQKTNLPIRVLKIKSRLPNLPSIIETHKKGAPIPLVGS